MQPNQQYNPVPNSDPNSVPPASGAMPVNDPWSTSPQPVAQPNYQQPQVGAAPTEQPYDPWKIQIPQPGTFQQPGATPTSPPQQWNPETSMFEPVQPARPSEWEQQFVAETVAAASAPPAPKKSHAGRIIMIILGIVLLLGGAAAAYVYAQQNQARNTQPVAAAPVDAKALFYQAIENHMKVNYIRQEYDMEQTDESMGHMIGHVVGISDFSNPALPKSKITYTVKSDDAKSPMDLAGELLDLQEDNYYYGMLTKNAVTEPSAQTATEANIAANTWYKISKADMAMSIFVFDIGGFRQSVNITTGQVVVGNYSDENRQELMTFIKDHEVYKIKSNEAVTVDNQKMTKYGIEIDDKTLAELNDRAKAALKLDTETDVQSTLQGDKVKYEFLVDNTTKRIMRVKLERPSSDGKAVDSSTITLSYPKSVTDDLKKPSTVKELPVQQ